jgi:hypothetical protein
MPINYVTAGSIVFLQASRRFAERALELDDPIAFASCDQSRQIAIQSELRDTALAAVITAQSMVEASINELFTGTLKSDHWFRGLKRDAARSLSDAWGGIEMQSLETKVKTAVAIDGKEPVKFGEGAAQQLSNLIYLRNSLVHHKLEWAQISESDAASDDELERKMHACFDTARIWQGRRGAYRWDRCLGAPCAVWAYNTGVSFEREFYQHLGIGYPNQGTSPIRTGLAITGST